MERDFPGIYGNESKNKGKTTEKITRTIDEQQKRTLRENQYLFDICSYLKIENQRTPAASRAT